MGRKYSAGFKRKIVQEYMQGMEGYKLLAKKHGIPDHSQIRKWVNPFQQYGSKALERKQTKQTYTSEFKLEVLHDMKTTGASLKETANQFDIHELSHPKHMGEKVSTRWCGSPIEIERESIYRDESKKKKTLQKEKRDT